MNFLSRSKSLYKFSSLNALRIPVSVSSAVRIPRHFYSTEKPKHLVLSMVGKDRVGIVRDFAKFLAKDGGNVEESRMTKLGGEFAMILLVSLRSQTPEEFTEKLHKAFPGFNIHSSVTEDEAVAESDSSIKPYEIWVDGPDSTGIVAAVTDALASKSIAIDSVETETVAAPFAGYTTFHMILKARLPEGKVQMIEKQLEEVGDKFGVDIEVVDEEDAEDEDFEDGK
ncbi:hypothetical protein HK098_008056 [Nowakowskiella sp. JEL0407]|nr:hypothetical protein HK098_008056 [Nowakowskiella sp. JEL0407]